jgi:glycine hydroxymethyltransferase
MHVIAAKAVALAEAQQPSFVEYARQIIANAQTLADALVDRGYHIVSGGTDNHLMLVDLRNRNLTGKAAEAALGAVGITVNKNTVPGETQSPFVTSGIRIGTSAATTRGMREGEMRTIAGFIDRVLLEPTDEALAARVRADVRELARGFPLYTAAEAFQGEPL